MKIVDIKLIRKEKYEEGGKEIKPEEKRVNLKKKIKRNLKRKRMKVRGKED